LATRFRPCTLEKGLFQSKLDFFQKFIFLPPALMARGRKKAAPVTPEHQEVKSGEEGEETEVEDQQDSTVFLHQWVDNLDTKINKVLAVLGK